MHALLVVEFDDSVDKISRAMFAERLAQFEWQRDAKVQSAWTLEFEERSTREIALRSIRNYLDPACERARITRKECRAIVQLGPEPPVSG